MSFERAACGVRRTAAWVLALLVVSACEIEKVGIPATEAQLAMHAVLSASANTQVVLLERTRNGTVYLSAPSFDLEDPIGSDEGIAETGAIVTMTTPSGQTLTAFEDNVLRNDGKGGGNYRFGLPGSSLERSGTYRLSIITSRGERLTAETSVPGGSVANVAEARVFDRASDTLIVDWPAAPRARSYFVRIETPFGPRSFFSDSTRVRLTGELRNAGLEALPRVFIPGFPQAITVSAVDSNYYDWYRSHNETISGMGLVNRVRGGLGVFGSLVRLRFQALRVVAPQIEPSAGLFRLVDSPADQQAAPFTSLELYVESHATRDDQGDALSGRYTRRLRLGETGCAVCGLLGSVRSGHIEIALLKDWFASDTTEVFRGTISGDTIVGSYRVFGGPVHFVRQR